MSRSSKSLALLIVAMVVAACSDGGESARSVPVAAPAEDNVIEFGAHSIHVNALSTDQIPPQVTSSYGIVRSKNRALLNVAVIEKDTNLTVPASVTAEAVNLTGQLKGINMRKVEEQDQASGNVATYYIGELQVANRETLTFEVTVMLPGVDEPLQFEFKRQFFAD